MDQAPEKTESTEPAAERGCLLQIAAFVITFVIAMLVPPTRHSLNLSALTKLLIIGLQIIAIFVFFREFPKGRVASGPLILLCLVSLLFLFFAIGNLGLTWLHH